MNQYYTLYNAREITKTLNHLLDVANQCGISVIAPFEDRIAQFEFHVIEDDESDGFCIGIVDID